MSAVKLIRCVLVVALATLPGWSAQAATPAQSELVQRGEYLATAGDCIACHTTPGGKPFAGGVPIPTPIGVIVGTNITPSKTAGIGNYSLEQFSDAVRKGIRADGKHLYPAMPYTAYAQVTDADIEAMYAYFMHAVEPVDTEPDPTSLPFPFNMRFLMAAWNLLFLDEEPFQPHPDKSEEWNRGAYLVRGLTHCGTCHTPRNLLMGENSSQALAGGRVGVWLAPNITSDANGGIGGWSQKEIVAYLRTGHIAKAQAAGPMLEAVVHSFQHMTDADLAAIATYLKAVPAVADEGIEQSVYGWGTASEQLPSVRGVSWPDDPAELTGPQLYDAYCATCHGADGEGSFDGSMPAMFHNAATGRPNTNNLVMVILQGIHRGPRLDQTRMPGFAEEFSNTQIATLGNYLTQTYGNPGAEITVEQVRSLRTGRTVSASVDYVLLARIGLAVVAILVVLAVALMLLFWRKRRTPS